MLQYLFTISWSTSKIYDLVINVDKLGVGGTVKMIKDIVLNK